MLKSLFIQNYAIIEELQMQFGNQLNIITGETGAGKSILTGALGLIQGNRADTKILYDHDKKCIVEAEFHDESKGVQAIFKSADIEFESPILIRRVISPSGKSRAFVNDEPVNLGFLRNLSSILVDMHRQHDTLGINQESTQISMLDSLAANQDKLKKYKKLFSQYRKEKNKLHVLIEEESKVKQELDFLEFQIKELDEAAFVENEQEALENEVNMLQNADSIISTLQKINFQLEESDNSIVQQISEFTNELDRLGDVGSQAQELLERLNSVTEELRDISNDSSGLSSDIDSDPTRLEEKQERLNLLYRVLQKHHMEDLNDLLVFHDELATKIFKLKSYGKDRSALEEAVLKAESELKKQGAVIRTARQKSGPVFEKKVKIILSELGMEHAQFIVQIDKAKELRNSGIDQVEFLFSANPGKAPQALNEVASGGELSRLALSLKSIVAGNIELGTMIFDEIDTGISGDVSGKMGVILSKLATKHQLISITHSAQIASKADTHFFIYKVIENERTYTKVKVLPEEGRIVEIAKMLSGNPPSTSAMENAKELLGV